MKLWKPKLNGGFCSKTSPGVLINVNNVVLTALSSPSLRRLFFFLNEYFRVDVRTSVRIWPVWLANVTYWEGFRELPPTLPVRGAACSASRQCVWAWLRQRTVHLNEGSFPHRSRLAASQNKSRGHPGKETFEKVPQKHAEPDFRSDGPECEKT